MKHAAAPGAVITLAEQLEEVGRLVRRRRMLADLANDESPAKAEWLKASDEGIAEARVELQMAAAAVKDGDEILTFLISKQVGYVHEWGEELMQWSAQRES
jgi:hypothetical protein